MVGSTIYMLDTNNFDQYGLTWELCLPIYIGLICFCSYQLGYYFPTIYKNIKKKKTANN